MQTRVNVLSNRRRRRRERCKLRTIKYRGLGRPTAGGQRKWQMHAVRACVCVCECAFIHAGQDKLHLIVSGQRRIRRQQVAGERANRK